LDPTELEAIRARAREPRTNPYSRLGEELGSDQGAATTRQGDEGPVQDTAPTDERGYLQLVADPDDEIQTEVTCSLPVTRTAVCRELNTPLSYLAQVLPSAMPSHGPSNIFEC